MCLCFDVNYVDWNAIMKLGQSTFSWQQDQNINNAWQLLNSRAEAMENFESDYSEDFEEEVLRSAKPSAGSLSVRRQRQRQGGREPEGGVERARQSKGSQLQLGEDRHSTVRRQQAIEKRRTTTSKSTGKLM